MARDIYRSGPSKEEIAELAAFGLTADDLNLAGDEVPLWPEHADVASILGVMSTQWNRDFNGQRIGLKYEALPCVLSLMGVDTSKQVDLVMDLRLMEREVLIMDREE